MKSLGETPLFASLDDEERAVLNGIVAKKTFPKDAVIIHKGQLSDELYVLGSGEVKVSLPTREGHEVTLAMLEPGAFFGEMALFSDDQQPRSANVTTTIDSDLFVITRQDFTKVAAKHPGIALKVLSGVVARLRAADEKIAGLSLVDVYAELARYREAMDTHKQIYETKLEAALEEWNAKLQATETVFEQTRQSADQVVQDAQRARSRVAYTLSTLVAAATVLGALGVFVGLQELADVRKTHDEVQQIQGRVETLVAAIEDDVEEIAAARDKVHQLDETLAVLETAVVTTPFDQALDELWNADLERAAFEEKVRALVGELEARSGSPAPTRPFLDQIDLRLMAANAGDFERILVLTDVAREKATIPAEQILARYLTLVAYLLDPAGGHRPAIADARVTLRKLVQENEGFDLGNWNFEVGNYEINDIATRAEVREIQELVERYAA